MKGYAKKIVPLLLAAAVTGCLCMGITALAQEAGEGTAGEAMELREEQQGQAAAPRDDEGAAQTETDNKCGENLTWSLDEAGTLTISGSGGMDDYELKTAPWFAQQASIKKVVLEDGVTSIGTYAFSRCSALKSIGLPTSVTMIRESAFSECSTLESVELPVSVTMIGESAFSECSTLESIGLPASVTTIGKAAFSFCSALESINIPAGVTTVEDSTFLYCSKLGSIEFPASVTTIGHSAFSYCSALESINIPDSVTSIGANAFSCCGVLKRIKLPAGLTAIEESAFSSCRTLGSIELPASVTSIGYSAFSYCSALKSINIPAGVTTIEESAFFDCRQLKELTIPRSVSEMGEYAYGYLDFVSSEDDYEINKAAKIKCYANTKGESYAKENGIPYELLDGGGSKDPGNGGQTVKPVKVSKITISRISKKGEVETGKKVKLTAKVSPSNAANQAVKWTSSDTKLATVSSSGVVTIKKKAAGKTVTITATAKDGSKVKASYKIKVIGVKKVAISGKKTKTVKAGKTLKLTAKVTASKNANKKLKWTSGNKKYATVNASGKVSAKKAGKGKKVKITAAATDGSGRKASVTIKIK